VPDVITAVQPACSSNFGDSAFSAAEPRVWNILLTVLTQPDLSYSHFIQSPKNFILVIGTKVQCELPFNCALKIILLTYLLAYLLLLLVAVGGSGDRFLSHHELRPSVGPVLNPYPHNGVCARMCVYRHKAEVSAYACAYASVVSSLCLVYFSSPATLRFTCLLIHKHVQVETGRYSHRVHKCQSGGRQRAFRTN